MRSEHHQFRLIVNPEHQSPRHERIEHFLFGTLTIPQLIAALFDPKNWFRVDNETETLVEERFNPRRKELFHTGVPALTEKVRCASASHPEQQESLESEINPQPDTGTVGYTIFIRVTGFEVHTRAATETFRHSE